MNALVSIRGLEKRFDKVDVLKGIDLDINEGEFFSLLGPSGCGKTTLLRAIAGFEAPDAGSVSIAGQDMAGVAPNKRPTNMVFQSYAIFPHLSVADNVAFGLKKAGIARSDALINETLELVGLAGLGARAAHALSGGQRQRVALARTLILKPKVLLLDEPLSALDKKLREQMQSELRRLQRQVGITFVLVTHDQEEALILSDRIAVMFEGRIAQLAAPDQLYQAPATRAVAEFIGLMNFVPAIAQGDDLLLQGLGTMPRPGHIKTGRLDVGLRPETLSILGQEDAADFEAHGIVSDRIYYGDMTTYTVALQGGCSVNIAMKNRASVRIYETDEPVRISWEPASIVTF
ncbi:MAG: ABC transporter ATP-binding protein [Pseudomonadota bacterium]